MSFVVLWWADLMEIIGPWWLMFMIVLLVLVMPVAIFVVAQWEKRLMRRLAEAAYRLCPRCGHRLTGLAQTTACPECGESCDLERVEQSWRSFRPTILGPFV